MFKNWTKMKRNKNTFLLFGLLILTGISIGVEIRDLQVPSVVESESMPFVILDCNYEVSPGETETGLDIKWFFNNDPQPFYQWIPGRRPQVIGDIFKDRLDLNYAHEPEIQHKKHRALKILRPTAELSGIYKCKVGSLFDEDFMQRKMIVYSPASDVTLIYTKPNQEMVNLTCSATRVYPKPELGLSWGTREHERGEMTTLTVEKDGYFDISVHKILREDLLRPETVFGCEVTIPGTSYSVREETMYFPGKVMYQITASGSHNINTKAKFSLLASAVIASIMLSSILSSNLEKVHR